MEISSGLSRPIGFYSSNTGNNTNLAVNSENKLYNSSTFSQGLILKETAKIATKPIKRKKKNKRLNTIDCDFLPDEIVETSPDNDERVSFNFFEVKPNPIQENIKKIFDFIFTKIPLINYYYLKHKEKKIKMTVEILKDIVQNSGELINTSVPYGENNKVYNNIAKNLTKAVSLVNKANKEF